MYNQLREIVNLLEKINSYCQTNTISVEQFKEQQDNLNDLSAIINDMDKLLQKSKRIDLNNVQEVDLLLFEIHKMTTLLEWHIPEISDLNIRLLKKNMEA
ncbi:hypothetical protein [Bacillus vallismortis]|uniref:hypothetical protein n=1 Tax=Bacillus vallismortis TaxID=72361 RepID=UPI0002891919|nr:hypothetical protein [Bacillus vallismortis]MBG9771447.1 hypothetical protein [Bacillus vallismortis]MEC1270687.1 hypothetical protein [Bacillus vallismortis]QAV09767.1 hypothetical protein BV11031_14740 [Bacillus vallismortis]